MADVELEAKGDAQPSKSHLRFAPATLIHLGERLIPHAEQGIVELAKNAFDADAELCTVKLGNKGRTITVADDGDGMTRDQVVDGWLVLGQSSKQEKTPTKRFDRIPVGDKGLGRLAALRLGRVAKLTTRPRSEPGVEYTVTLDWSLYDAANTVEDVALLVERSATTKSHGTEIEISQLRKLLSRSDLDKLSRSLVLLSSPFEAEREFRVSLKVPEYNDLEKRVANFYFDAAQYIIEAKLDKGGQAIFRLLDWKGEETSPSSPGPRKYESVPATFELWAFTLDAGSFSTRNARLNDVRPWLAAVGGVHVYEGPIRVPPYGSSGNDWLEMNLRRARSPEGRPSTNNSVGRVVVENSSGELVQKTDRVGYVDNHAFSELREFCADALEWANKRIMAPIEVERQRRREDAERQTQAARADVAKVVAGLEPGARKTVEVALERLVTERESRVRSLQQDLQLYRSLATAGMTSAVFAHEIGKPLNILSRNLPRIEAAIIPEKRNSLGGVLKLLRSSAERLNTYVTLPLSLLAKDKRRVGRVGITASAAEIVRLYRPIFSAAKVEVETQFCPEMYITGSVALFDGIFINLFANSVTAFQREGVDPEQRRVRVMIEHSDGAAIIKVVDNAGGLRGLSESEIWLPGVTTTEDGTGFGLTIIRDSMTDLGGTITVNGMTDYGGAEFTMRIPVIAGALL